MTLGLVNRSDLACLGLMTASMHLHIRHWHKIGTLAVSTNLCLLPTLFKLAFRSTYACEGG